MFSFFRKSSSAIKIVDPSLVMDWVREGSAVIVDVREPGEWAQGHIPGAVLVPLSTFDPTKVPAVAEGQHLVFHCQSGRRCDPASKQMAAAGFKGGINRLAGGFMGWKGAGGAVAL